MKYKIIPTSKFKKDLKVIIKRGHDMQALDKVVTTIAQGKYLGQKFADHSLMGKYSGFRECHISPDWLLVYKIDKNLLILTLTRTGTHSDLFNK